MPVVIEQDLEQDVATYDAVVKEIDPESSPPDGMILHSASRMEGGGLHIVDVWESKEAHDRFVQERLMPAVEKAGGQAPDGPPDLDVYEVHHLVKP